MKQQPKKRPIMDERDMQIEVHSKAHSLEYVTTVAMILTVLCLLKDNPAWNDLSAVKSGQVYYMDKMLYNFKPNARWGEAYEGLDEVLAK